MTSKPNLPPSLLGKAQLDALLESVDSMNEQEAAQLFAELEAYETELKRVAARASFLEFCVYIDPNFLIGSHHRILAEKLEDLAYGRINRLAISMPPRHGKSVMCSQLFPAWYLGHFPARHIIGASNTTKLAEDNIGRKIRDHIMSEEYRGLFPKTEIRADTSGAGRWATTKGGMGYFVGCGGALAGRGAHLCIVDDPHSEVDLQGGVDVNFNNAYLWYQTGPRQRLMVNGSILLIHTRWHKHDMIGRVLDNSAKNADADRWEYVELPAILPSGDPLWPAMFSRKALLSTKASMAPYLWSAQYQQQPINAESAIIKREDFKRWTRDAAPTCDYILGALDTAMESNNRADYSALTVWGVFRPDREDKESPYNIILLDMYKERLEFPALKKLAIEQYREWEMDTLAIERKNSGASLIQDLSQTGIITYSYKPGTQDKVARLNGVSDIIASGLVWIPDGYGWAEEFIEEICGFPGEPHDDLVDSMIIGLSRFRQGGFITLPDDWTVGGSNPDEISEADGGLYWP